MFNYDLADLNRSEDPLGIISGSVGDARDLSPMADKQFGFYHSSSVIEHVGGWSDMNAMALEAVRVASHGWVEPPPGSYR